MKARLSGFDVVEVEVTDSTNRLAAETGRAGQVFCAHYQTAGRGRLDHRWIAPPGVNLAMSVVLPVAGWPIEEVATLPLVVGLAVLRAVETLVGVASSPHRRVTLKWPNDVLIDGRKVSGILCERHGDNVVAGIGVNALPREFPPEIAATATCLAAKMPQDAAGILRVADVRTAILAELADCFELVRREGFAVLYPQFDAVDYLKGLSLAVLQTDSDTEPVRGLCGGIASDGSLLVNGKSVYAGEAHVIL